MIENHERSSLSKKVTEKWPFSRIGDENAV